MLKIVKTTKTQIRYLQKLLPSPTRIRENAISLTTFTTNGFDAIKIFIRDARNSYTNIYENNMNLAIFHQQSGNMIDAKLRYTIAYVFKKYHPEPLLGLAEIAIVKKQNKKAVKYFKKALPLITNKDQRTQIEQIMYEISI